MALTQITTDGIKDGTITGTDLTTNIDLIDNQKLRLGTGNDLQIYHDPSTNNIIDNVGSLTIQKTDGEKYIHCSSNDQVELYHNGSKKLDTDASGINVTGDIDVTNKVALIDNGKLICGVGDDLQIYHDGTHSRIVNNTGTLFTQADEVRFKNNANNETLFVAAANGAVELYHDNSKKFETASYGVKTTGEVEIDSGHLRGDSTNGLRMFSDSTATTGITLTTDDDLVPQTNNAQDLGTTSLRWRNIYTNDLNLSNEGGANDVDGTWGSYTIQEGAEDLFLVNKRNGKKYKFALTEVA